MDSLNMSLDDMIISKRTANNRGRGRGRGRGGGRGQGRSFGGGRGQGRSFGGGRPMGPPRRGPLAVNARPSAYSIAKASSNLWISYAFDRKRFLPKSLPWQRDLFEESLKAAGLPGVDSGAKLNISNLHSGVSNEDIRELFSEIGELKRYAIHYDRNGRPSVSINISCFRIEYRQMYAILRSEGSAEVLFARRSDAFQALKRYNSVQLDGRPMRIEIEGSKSEIPISARVNVVGGLNGQRTVVMRSCPQITSFSSELRSTLYSRSIDG
ncbi:THO complex subunit 4D-like protein [Tanacetum coccineum]